ncbi:MAG: hypothetical protein ABW022_03070 [Actinoplanes sp.]
MIDPHRASNETVALVLCGKNDIPTPTFQENDMIFGSASTSSPLREPIKTLREKGADSFHAALAAALVTSLDVALEAGDHPRAVSIINRGFAEGNPQLGCDLLCRAIAVVGTARTWTVQLAPQTDARQRSAL